MLPVATQGAPDGALRHAIVGGDVLLPDATRRPAGADGADIVLGQAGLRVALTARAGRERGRVPRPATLATLRHLVGDVIGMGAQEEVIGVDTGGVVAAMADDQAIGDAAMLQGVGK